MIDPHIFREYDIRGDVRTQLTPEAAFQIGRALGAARFAPGSTLCIGRDARLSSPELADRLIAGLTMQGVRIVDLGMITTPMLYFALFGQPYDGGVMITGSHNPVNDNGLKICRGTESFLRADIEAVYEKTQTGIAPADIPGTVRHYDISEEYESAIVQRIHPERKLRLVIDAGSGVAGPFAQKIIGHFADSLECLYCDPDGSFPHHHPDPSIRANVETCRQTVLRTHADLGLAFDGDGDRLGIIDRDGTLLPADRIIILFAREILARVSGATIIGDVKCSKFTFDDVKNHGGIPCMTKTGHALIKAKIRETGAALAGEMSGHFFFGDRWFGFDDAIYAAARICEIAASTDGTLGALLSGLPDACATPELRFDCPDAVKFDIARAIAEHYKPIWPTSDLDGARIDFPHGWALVRASNTQPVLVARVEADTPNHTREILADIRAQIDHEASIRHVKLDLSALEF